MFKTKILQKLKELNINTITRTLKEAETIHPLINLPISVQPPYFFLKLFDESQLDKYLRGQYAVGYITVNGTTTLILYIKDPEVQNKYSPIINIEGVNPNFMFVSELTLKHTDKISIFHKSFKKKAEVNTSAQSSIVDELAELSKKPNNLFYADYAQKHPYFYLYQQPLRAKDKNFKDYKFFKLYCTLLYIAEKSNTLKQKRTQCHISSRDLKAIVPNCFKYVRQKKGTPKSSNKKPYSKSYITFLDIACNAGMVKEYQLKDEYISITFSDSFLEELCQPPYIKIPFSLLDEITSNNYRFIIYFINRQFSNNPKHPCFFNMKIKDLLKISNISLSTSQAMAAQRLNSYLNILEKYQVISEQITYIADDIRKNKLLKFRLYHFKHISLDVDDDEYEEE